MSKGQVRFFLTFSDLASLGKPRPGSHRYDRRGEANLTLHYPKTIGTIERMERPRRPYNKAEMTRTQALGLAKLLLEWELESPQVESPPEGWQFELREAKQVLDRMLSELHPQPG